MYLVRYPLLKNIPVRKRGIDHRYMTDPLCLLYSKSTGDLIPLAIQLSHDTPENAQQVPIYTPRSKVGKQIMLSHTQTNVLLYIISLCNILFIG